MNYPHLTPLLLLKLATKSPRALVFAPRFFSCLRATSCQAQKQEDRLTNSTANEHAQLSTHLTGAGKAKQAAKDASYGMVILAGGLLVVATGYYLISELFSRETPSGIYDESSKMCLENFEVREALGTPIKVTAESGGRRVFQIK